MRHLFLYGDLSDNFATVVAPFVAAAGGARARIALLLMGGPGSVAYLPRYRDPMLAAGAAEVVAIMPDESGALPPGAAAVSESATGIFMGGGVPRRYHELYVASALGPRIRARYQAGVPYGGLSAGALLACATGTVAGHWAEAGPNRFWLRPQPDGDPEPLALAPGLGLLRDCTVDVHLAEFGTFPRLVAAMEQAGSAWGIGLDEPVCVEVRDEAALVVSGRGRAYLARAAGARRFDLQVLEPGAVVSI